ncbi:MAG: hypothetical protein ACK496_17150 [Acidobacteriota bacterium]
MLVKSTVRLMMSFFLVLGVLITEANSYASRRGGVVDKPSTSPQPDLIAPLLMEEQADSSIDMQTGEKLRGGLISVAQQIVDASIGKLGEEARATANSYEASLLRVSNNLGEVLGKNVTKPIGNLGTDLRVVALVADSTLREAQAYLKKLESCSVGDLSILLSSLNSMVTSNVSTLAFWKKREPIVFRVDKLASNVGLGGVDRTVYVNEPIQLILRGANLGSSTVCADGAVELFTRVKNRTDDLTNVRIESIDNEKIVLQADPASRAGVYKITVRLGKRAGRSGCKGYREVTSYFSVVERVRYDVSYSITPSCERTVTSLVDGSYRQEMRLELVNDSCSVAKTASLSWVAPEGFEILRHEFIEEANPNGKARKIVDKVVGNMIRIDYEVPPRDRDWFFCASNGKAIKGHLNVVMTKKEVTDSSDISGNIEGGLGPEMTRNIRVAPPVCEGRVTGWVVRVRITDQNLKENDMPPLSTAHDNNVWPQFANDIKVTWLPLSRDLTLTTPTVACGR